MGFAPSGTVVLTFSKVGQSSALSLWLGASVQRSAWFKPNAVLRSAVKRSKWTLGIEVEEKEGHTG